MFVRVIFDSSVLDTFYFILRQAQYDNKKIEQTKSKIVSRTNTILL